MQYGYGMAETHQQQFMEGDSCSSLFSISTPQKQNQHHHLHYQHHHHHHHLPPPPPPHQQQKHERQQQQQQFFQLHPVPFTQQLLQQQHQFEVFQLQQQQQQQQRRLHQQLRLENEQGRNGGGGGEGVGNGGGGEGGSASLPFFNFKLGLNENSGNREVVMNEEDKEEDGLIGGSEEHIPGNRPNSLEMPQCCWQSQGDGTIKEPFWKPLNAQLFNKNDKETNEDEEKKEEGEGNKKINHGQVLDNDGGKNLGNKYRFFGELEAICSGAGLGETNQTGSGSALTGENMTRNAGLLRPLADPHCSNLGGAAAAIGVDHGSETSIGEEAALRKLQKRKRRRKMKEELNSMAGFFESLVKQLMDHQEGLYRKFLEVVERIDQERMEREEAWRSKQLENFNREATARAHEQTLASSREVAVVSYLEKITGQSIDLPNKNNTQLHSQRYLPKEPVKINNFSSSNTNSRWPKAEVQALIQVRSRLESRFQEPGLKGPLWEEISSSMTSMGYQRSAKRCKEKWENINKYFRKTKDSAKKRSHQSKTCPYFHQLDQLYSRTPFYPNPSASTDSGVHNLKVNSELLDAIIAMNDPNTAQKVAPMESFDGNIDYKSEADQQINHGKEKENHRDIEEGDQDMNNEDEEDDEQDNEEDDEEGGGGDGEEEDGD